MSALSLLLQCIANVIYVVEAIEYDLTKQICGNDGKTYDTIVDLHLAQIHHRKLRAVHEGPCQVKLSYAITLSDQFDDLHCSVDYSPVCGTDGKTYSNECSLNSDKAHDPTLHIQHNGPCEGHSKLNDMSCPATLDPVCGTDGETYSNKCLLFKEKRKNNNNLHIKHEGPCEEDVNDEIPCRFDYDPVCGTDGKTYENLCRLSANKIYHPSLEIEHVGPCRNSEELDYISKELLKPKKKCPLIGSPVCGNDGKTYSNMCFLKYNRFFDSGLRIMYYGRCKEDYEDFDNLLRKNKNRWCKLIWQPVCGTNGKTYGSECFLNEAKINNPTLSIKHNGVCAVNSKRSKKSARRHGKHNPSITKIDIKNSGKNYNKVNIDLRMLN